MWIGRILLVGYGSSHLARWVLSCRAHRNYIAGWLKALRKATRFIPRGRYRIRRFASRAFQNTLSPGNRRRSANRLQTGTAIGTINLLQQKIIEGGPDQ